MIKVESSNWTQEKLEAMGKAELQNLRNNAARLGEEQLVERCDKELSRRTPSRSQTVRTSARGEGRFVSEYHFVCERDRGVTPAPNDCFWSGSWVVSEDNVQESIKYGAHLALHEAKSEPSYRQGEVIDYRKAPRDIIDKTNEGIEFLVRPTDVALNWAGAGTGEKGYLWAPLKTRGSDIANEAPRS